ncbi:EamA family transporter [Agreia sp. PsM10]|uniref:EamA family transporter n=1 Tax=Agreia sp. PsM10 TaxID=3030533 RepID=UPI00263AA17C|nr:EamA family transporter [Agreia sp. PsM10]MDN4641517.1 EamA family transporter [Agreia sp. PsM10]
MLVTLFGLAGAFVYGAADFLGGLASRRLSPFAVTGIAAGSGAVVLVAVYPFVGGNWSAEAVLWGSISGVSGAIGISLLYACLAIGPMSILSPLTAVISAIVPLSIGLARGSAFHPIGYAALALALVAVVLVGFVPEKDAVRPSLRGILMAIGSGATIGIFLVAIDAAPADSGLVPLFLNRAVNGAIMGAVVLAAFLVARRRSDAMARPASASARPGAAGLGAALALALACGVADAAANGLILAGLRLGELSVTSVLTALYPAGTIILASIVLKERIAPLQAVGLVLALAAAAMLSLA